MRVRGLDTDPTLTAAAPAMSHVVSTSVITSYRHLRDVRSMQGECSLEQLLSACDLQNYEVPMRTVLKLRHAGDLEFVDETDLNSIGMSRPEQRRLRKEWAASRALLNPSLMSKLKQRVFGQKELKTPASTSGGRPVAEQSHPTQEQQSTAATIIPIEKITIVKELGMGEFGCVYKATWHKSESDTVQVAVKSVESIAMERVLEEASVWSRLRHEGITSLHGVVLDGRRLLLVSQWAPGGSVLHCLRNVGLRAQLNLQRLTDWARQIAEAALYLEEQRVVHRDLAARNVLVFSLDRVAITDFGLSRALAADRDYYAGQPMPDTRLPIAWCAPEAVRLLRFTHASDVWAFGVLLWELFSLGNTPFGQLNGKDILRLVESEGGRLVRPTLCHEEAYELMLSCWAHEPSQRPTFRQIVDSWWERGAVQRVRTIRAHSQRRHNELQFETNTPIFVISRSGEWWTGALENGQVGLFRPEDTLAELVSVNPTADKTTDGGSDDQRERRKREISEPLNVRHMCHIGLEDSSFGRLTADKAELGRALLLPPLLPPSSSSPTTVTPRSPSASPSFRSPPSVTAAAAAAAAAAATPLYTSKQPNQQQQQQHLFLPTTSTGSPTPSALSRTSPRPQVASATESAVNSGSSTPSVLRINGTASPLLLPRRAATDILLQMHHHTNDALNIDSLMSTTFSTGTQEADMTVNDTAPLVDLAAVGAPHESTPPLMKESDPSAQVRLMTNDERDRWTERSSRAHRKAERLLNAALAADAAAHARERRSETPNSEPSTSSAPADWSPEAQQAYQLLVDCGHLLADLNRQNRSQGDETDRHVPTGYDNVDGIHRLPPPIPPKPTRLPATTTATAAASAASTSATAPPLPLTGAVKQEVLRF